MKCCICKIFQPQTDKTLKASTENELKDSNSFPTSLWNCACLAMLTWNWFVFLHFSTKKTQKSAISFIWPSSKMQLIYLSHSKPPTGKIISSTVRELEDTRDKVTVPWCCSVAKHTANSQKFFERKKKNQSCLSYQINPLLLVNNREKLGSSASWESTPTQRASEELN